MQKPDSSGRSDPPGINTWHICLKYVVNYKTALVIGFNGQVFQADSFCVWFFTGRIKDLFRFNNLKPAILAFTKGDFITIPQICTGDFLYDNIMQKLDSVFVERIKECIAYFLVKKRKGFGIFTEDRYTCAQG